MIFIPDEIPYKTTEVTWDRDENRLGGTIKESRVDLPLLRTVPTATGHQSLRLSAGGLSLDPGKSRFASSDQ